MMSSSMDLDTTIPSEEILARKWDRCISNLVIKVATSTSVGILSSVTLFQKKTWPVALAAGFGLGLAYEQCQKYVKKAKPRKEKKRKETTFYFLVFHDLLSKMKNEEREID
ncbi:MICOS complex subunit MIC10 [Coelomomyces lativittatus]|nr:MICOS complex subunit MIC10 [Coelomomyces lativittatus]